MAVQHDGFHLRISGQDRQPPSPVYKTEAFSSSGRQKLTCEPQKRSLRPILFTRICPATSKNAEAIDDIHSMDLLAAQRPQEHNRVSMRSLLPVLGL